MKIYSKLYRYLNYVKKFNRIKVFRLFNFTNDNNFIKNNKIYRVTNKIKSYKQRKKKFYENKNSKFFNLHNCITLLVILFSFVYLFYNKFSIFSIYMSIFVYIVLMFYLLIFEKYIEKERINSTIINLQKEIEKERSVFLEKIKEMSEIEKNQLKNIILKDSDGYDIKIWEVGRASTLTLGKTTIRNRVDIDISTSIYSNLISRVHGVLNKVNGIWYYEDLGSQNGSGIEKYNDNRKMKVNKNIPVKVQSGDIIHLARTKILLK